MDTQVIESLLQNARQLSQHQEEIRRLRGENFNLFSIFNLESRENEGHSAFLAELLNPEGSHLKDGIFLRRFLEVIGYAGALDLGSAKVYVEAVIGKTDYEKRAGGRIDIYITDAKGYSISIENKIYAVDQHCQIERYVNHNRDRNTVYYLTLEGGLPSEASRGALVAGIDFHCISYRETIRDWLELCLKEAVEQPILRESIRQYIIIVKKITNQLTDHQMADKMRKLISNNYTAAKLIQTHVAEAEAEAVTGFMAALKDRIGKTLREGWTITVDPDLTRAWSGVSIEFEQWDGIGVRFQGEPQLIGGESIYGIAAHSKKWDRGEIKNRLDGHESIEILSRESAHWPYYRRVNFFHMSHFQDFFDRDVYERRLNEMASTLAELSLACQKPLSGIPRVEAG